MNRFTLRSLGVVLASVIIALSPLAAGAQPAPTADLTPDQVRAQFIRLGYHADAPITWWTNQVTTFRVYDPVEQASPTGRIVMVLIYADTATAEAERSKAQGREEGYLLDAVALDRSPRLVPGYGPSSWHKNVALVQASHQELVRQYAAELDRDNLVVVSTSGRTELTATRSRQAVDANFLGVLDNAVVTL
jgi:hypothetical protein